MLSVKPSERPTILDILNKMIVRRRVTTVMQELLLDGPPVGGPGLAHHQS